MVLFKILNPRRIMTHRIWKKIESVGKGIGKRVRGAGKKVKDAGRKIRGFMSRKIRGIFLAPIIYGKTVEEIILESSDKVDHFDTRINNLNFPVGKSCEAKNVPFKIFRRYANSEKAKKKGYRHADIFEILQIALMPEKIPRRYRSKSIVALGSAYQDQDGKKHVPVILGNEYSHEVPLVKCEDKWGRLFRFLMVY